MKRLLTIDAVRGFAILLVVLGHAIQPNDPGHDGTMVFRLIYSFHMPLFMFLSGFVASGRPINPVRKAVTLLIPFSVWFLISYFITGTYNHLSASSFLERVILYQDWGLWFLWILFVNFCLLALATRLPGRFADLGVVVAMVAMQYVTVPWEVLGFELVKWYFPFFAVGFLIATYRSRLTLLKRPLQIVALIAFPILVSFWYKGEPPSFAPDLSRTLSTYNIPGFDQILFVYAYAVPFLAITLVFLLISPLRGSPPFRAFRSLGLVTLEIYLTHEFFIYYLDKALGTGNKWILPDYFLALGLSLVFWFIISRSGPLRLILLGKEDGSTAPRVVLPAFLRRFNFSQGARAR